MLSDPKEFFRETIHSTMNDMSRYQTYKTDKQLFDEEQNFQQILRLHLNAVNNTNSKEEKINLVASLYQYIWENIEKLKDAQKYKKLRSIIVDKVDSVLDEQHFGAQVFFSKDQERVMLQVRSTIEDYENEQM